MGSINVFAKWDLENGVWTRDLTNKGRSIAVANYDSIVNNNGKFDYIIINHGSRVEDHSKDFEHIKETEAGINHIIDYFKKCNGNYVVKLFLMDADAPIIEDAKMFAKYVDSIAANPTTNSINIIGVSKCSVMNLYVPRFFKNPESFRKTNMYNAASPYDGTKMASPLVFYPEVKRVLLEKLKNETFTNMIYNKLIRIYEGISSNSHMDYDIAIPGGIPDSKKHLYDESLIKNVFCSENIDSIKKLNTFRNFLTGIDDKTLSEAIRTMNFNGIGLCILDSAFFEHKSDGMIYVESQKKIDDVIGQKSCKLISAHHDILSNKRVISGVLSQLEDKIQETNEKDAFVKKLII